MAAGKKKKKAASNPARGFATTSQPSKSKTSTNDSDKGTSLENHESVQYEVPESAQSSAPNNTQTEPDLQAMTPEELESYLEDAELQNIVESKSTRCKQDAARQVNKLESERRQMRSQAHQLSTFGWLSDETIKDVLQKTTHAESSVAQCCLQNISDDTEMLPRLWTLKIVLERLAFPNIDDALEYLLVLASQVKFAKSVEQIWGLQEVLEWYALNRDLPDYEHDIPSNDVTSVDATEESNSGHPHDTPQSPHVPSSNTISSHGQEQSSEESDDNTGLPPLSSTDSDDNDPSMLLDEYVRLQTMLFHTELQMKRSGKQFTNLQPRKSKLQQRVQRLQNDILLDRAAADVLWEQTLRELRIDTSKLLKPRKAISKRMEKQPDSDSELQSVNTEENADDILGAMFEEAQETVPEPASAEKNTVDVIDFGRWTGGSPRRLIEESSHNMDGRSKIKFYTLAATSYSNRQKMELRLSTQRHIESSALQVIQNKLDVVINAQRLVFEMKSIAAVNKEQAEAYLSTVTLFLLIQSGHIEPKQSLRLPTIWRNLYSELCQSRQSLVDATDKETLKDLRQIIQRVQDSIKDVQPVGISIDDNTLSKTSLPKQTFKKQAPLTTENAQALWQSKVSTPAYHQFLEVRKQLPVHNFKEEILQTISTNQLVIICADTGAGKSTQVPSFVLEHQLSSGQDCRILVTQPRRISAISLARRVSQELGEHKNDLGTDRSVVGYAIRLESKTSKSTRITFATTGVLLRMIESSPQLNDLDYLILDEVHERTLDVDLLFIALKRLMQKRTDLKVILMSATLNAEKFSTYFDGSPILNLPGRTFPVEILYLEDAIESTLDIKANGHSVGEYEDAGNESTDEDKRTTSLEGLENYSSKTKSKLSQMDEYRIDYDVIAALAEAIATKANYVKYSSAILIFMPGIAEIRRLQNMLASRYTFSTNWIIHLLHSSFSTDDLEKAFSKPPPGYRKIVIATNIAETGITIPDVTAVIDTCKEKVMRFDERRQLSRLTEGFISRSSARQRRGRAARVQEGLCFHLVTRHRFENLMLEQHVPEMLRLSLQDPILRIKIWNLGSAEETLAAAIDPPTGKNVRRAVDKLKDAGALNTAEELTPLGQIIARLPLEVLLSKLAVFGIVFKCLDAVLTIIAAVSTKSPFLLDKGGHQADPRLNFARGESDLISTLNAYQGWRRARKQGQAHSYCRKHHLSDQNLSSINDQKIQLLVYLVDAGLVQLGAEERNALGRWRNSSHHKDSFDIPDRYNIYDNDAMLNCVIAISFYPKLLVREGKGWRNVYSSQRVNLTPNSVHRITNKPPKWLSFYEAMQTRSGSLNVLETSKVSEAVIATILGSGDFRFFPGVISLDNGKIRFSVRGWKQLAALKTLRESLVGVLDRCWRAPGLSMSGSDEEWLEFFARMIVNNDGRIQKLG